MLALFIPTRQPANVDALMAQANAILTTGARTGAEVMRHNSSASAMRALDAIHDRLESPADRMLRTVSLRSNYVVLPVFALANAGVVLSAEVFGGHGTLLLAIVLGLVVGKPLGLVSVSALAVWLGIAVKPGEYSWRQLAGAGALAGIGFNDVAVHRRAGVSRRRRFRCREDRRVCGIGHRCRTWRDDSVDREWPDRPVKWPGAAAPVAAPTQRSAVALALSSARVPRSCPSNP